MYEEHFNLSGAPFKLNPDPKFFFGSRSHNKAMAYLHYGLKQAEGFIAITGPIGSGKTMVISQLLDQLSASNVIAAQLLTSNIAPEELLDHILSAFRIEPEGDGRTGKLEAFEDYLFDQLNRGRRVLLIMDEAQNLPFETLEELRMLSNLDYDGTPLFQVFLVGQPEFRDIMQSERLEQLRQRVIASYHLENLSVEETREYIHHRLAIAGWREDPTFSDEAIKAIYEETGGRPRRINTVCNRIMLYCSLEDKHDVTGEIAESVIGELHEEELDARDTALDESDASAPAPAKRMPAVKPVAAPEQETPAASEETDLPPQDDDDVSAEGEEDMSKKELESSEPTSDENASEPATDSDDNQPVAKDAEPAGEITSDKPAAETKKSGSGSVFDRVRAKRSGDEGAAPDATLEDVASAIAKASAGGMAEEFPSDNGADDDMTAPPLAPLDSVQSSELRKQMRESIDETRGELKEAHASVQRLRKSLADMRKRRGNSREQIAAGLKRAETVLREVTKRWS